MIKEIEYMKGHLCEGAGIRAVLATKDPDFLDDMNTWAHVTAERVFVHGSKVILFGNGGSFSQAQHIVAELVGRACGPYPVQALSLSEGPTLTAIANDRGYENIFSEQMTAHGRAKDIAVGITTSGASKNVLKGLLAAKRLDMFVVALTGELGLLGLKEDRDVLIQVPSAEVQQIQELHLSIGHMYCQMVQDKIKERMEGADANK